MRIERIIASTPVRTAEETAEIIIEFATSFVGGAAVGDLSRAKVILRHIVLYRIRPNQRVEVRYGEHSLHLGCAYDSDALEIDEYDEAPPSRVPQPSDDSTSWTLHVPCPDKLRPWADSVIKTNGIGSWLILEPRTSKHAAQAVPETEDRPDKGKPLVDISSLKSALQTPRDKEHHG